jgi:hypothetical protein
MELIVLKMNLSKENFCLQDRFFIKKFVRQDILHFKVLPTDKKVGHR